MPMDSIDIEASNPCYPRTMLAEIKTYIQRDDVDLSYYRLWKGEELA